MPEVRNGERLSGFETVLDACEERTKRRASLNAFARACDLEDHLEFDGRAARTLATALKACTALHGLPNFADPIFTRVFRNRFISHVMAAVAAEAGQATVKLYTIWAEGWRRSPEQLRAFDVTQLREALRAHLIRAGLAELSGWFILVVHGEYMTAGGYFQIHFHAVVVGDKCQAFEALRAIPAFEGGRQAAIYRPVVAQDVVNPARQLSYVFQPFWPRKQLGEAPGVDKPYSRGPRLRIPEPAHARYLLWLSRQNFADLVWMHGIAVRNGRLEPT